MLSERAAERGSASLIPSPSLQQPSLCISQSLHCTTAHLHSRGLFLLPEPGTSAAQMFPAHRDALLPTPSASCLQTKPDGTAIQGISGVSLGPSLIRTPSPSSRPSLPQPRLKCTHTHTQGISKNSMAQAEAINQLPSRISSKPRAGPSVPGISNIIKGGEAGKRDRHRLVKYFRKDKKMGELVLVGHTSHNSWTHNLKKVLELLFA